MTKKNFIALAAAIRRANQLTKDHPFAQHGSELNPGEFSRGHIQTIANFCSSQNPNFNRERFLAACGVENNHCICTPYAIDINPNCKAKTHLL